MQQVSPRLIGRTISRLVEVPDEKIAVCLDRWHERQPHIIGYLMHAEDHLPSLYEGRLIQLFWLIAEAVQGVAEVPLVPDELIVRAHKANEALVDVEPDSPEFDARMGEHFASFPQWPLFEFAFESLQIIKGDCSGESDEDIEPGLFAIKTVLDCLHQVSERAADGAKPG